MYHSTKIPYSDVIKYKEMLNSLNLSPHSISQNTSIISCAIDSLLNNSEYVYLDYNEFIPFKYVIKNDKKCGIIFKENNEKIDYYLDKLKKELFLKKIIFIPNELQLELEQNGIYTINFFKTNKIEKLQENEEKDTKHFLIPLKNGYSGNYSNLEEYIKKNKKIKKHEFEFYEYQNSDTFHIRGIYDSKQSQYKIIGIIDKIDIIDKNNVVSIEKRTKGKTYKNYLFFKKEITKSHDFNNLINVIENFDKKLSDRNQSIKNLFTISTTTP